MISRRLFLGRVGAAIAAMTAVPFALPAIERQVVVAAKPVMDAFIPELWARESLAILEENMVLGNLVHRDFGDLIFKEGDQCQTARLGTRLSVASPLAS